MLRASSAPVLCPGNTNVPQREGMYKSLRVGFYRFIFLHRFWEWYGVECRRIALPFSNVSAYTLRDCGFAARAMLGRNIGAKHAASLSILGSFVI